ncbi:MAG: 3'(2'),5'-bisphosphate nucleotidase, partial [Anaerolineae bacterium]|nr:3'(2'),5'-bisphosphate nucleotidase [Anaerolineae bacterium]
MPDYDRERRAAREAARAAGKLCRTIRAELLATPQQVEKAGREPVTLADFSSQAVILSQLAAQFPGDAVFAEERGADFEALLSAAQREQILRYVGQGPGRAVSIAEVTDWLDFGRGAQATRAWAVDPIDGTKGFIRGDQFAIAIGLIVDGEAVVSALACPLLS